MTVNSTVPNWVIQDCARKNMALFMKYRAPRTRVVHNLNGYAVHEVNGELQVRSFCSPNAKSGSETQLVKPQYLGKSLTPCFQLRATNKYDETYQIAVTVAQLRKLWNLQLKYEVVAK